MSNPKHGKPNRPTRPARDTRPVRPIAYGLQRADKRRRPFTVVWFRDIPADGVVR
jgi:hypothetical protein